MNANVYGDAKQPRRHSHVALGRTERSPTLARSSQDVTLFGLRQEQDFSSLGSVFSLAVRRTSAQPADENSGPPACLAMGYAGCLAWLGLAVFLSVRVSMCPCVGSSAVSASGRPPRRGRTQELGVEWGGPLIRLHWRQSLAGTGGRHRGYPLARETPGRGAQRPFVRCHSLHIVAGLVVEGPWREGGRNEGRRGKWRRGRRKKG